jgi:uncharacterized iron-regulated membrane protein
MTDAARRRPDRSLYQAIWRWHFIAGLTVMPVLLMMAITGALYMFKDEITLLVYGKMIEVPVRSTPMAPLSSVIAHAETALHGRVLQISPTLPNYAVRMIVRLPSGEALTAYGDPYNARLLGSFPYGGIMQTVRKIHSLQKFGFWASCIVEIVAGWAIILVGTGIYMWWPRSAGGGVMSVRGKPRSRVFWRDIHALTGAFGGLIIAFLALTGMPWSLFWGANVQTWVGKHQLYAPAAPAYTQREEMMGMKMPADPKSSISSNAATAAIAAELPWSMEKARQPSSAEGAMPGMPGMEAAPVGTSKTDMRKPIGVDAALARFRSLGLTSYFDLALPIGPAGIYVANFRPLKLEDTRTIYLDQYTGKLLGDISFRDWYVGGKVIEWSTAVHQGREYGDLNRYLMLAGCAAVVLLAISSLTMWWKRRPSGQWGLPQAPADPGVARGLLAFMIPIGVIFPLVGLSMVVAGLIEVAYRWSRGRQGVGTA